MAGRTFQMGAKMTLKDQFKGVISNIARSTMDFKRSVDTTNRSVNTFKDSTGRLHDATGKYVAQSKKANVSTRAWISSSGKMGASLGFMQRGLAGVVAYFGLMKAKSWLIDANADMETYKNTLSVVLKDEKKATETLAWATKFAAQTPFEIPQIVEATTRMSAYGINAQKTLGIVGDMAAVMGKDLMQAVEAVADAQTGELERLKEFGITKGMIDQQAKAMKLQVINNKGQITDQKAFNAVLFKLMEGRFKDGMKMQSKTFKGMMSNVKDFMGSMGRTLGGPIFEAAKKGLGNVLDWANKLQANGSIEAFGKKVQAAVDVGVKAFGKIKAYISAMVWYIRQKFSQIYTNNKPFIDKLVGAFNTAISWLQTNIPPILNWIAYTGVPAVVGVLTTLADWVLKIANWFVTNWGWIGPIIEGIAIALGTYLAIGGAVIAATKAWAVVQGILNAVMAINPVMLIVIAIGILIGLIILLVKNWGTVKTVLMAGAQAIGNFFVGIWNGIKAAFMAVWKVIVAYFMFVFLVYKTIFTAIWDVAVNVFNGIWGVVQAVVGWIVEAWGNVKAAFVAVWDGIMAVVKAPINFLLKAINTIIKGLNGISIDIPDWVPLLGGKKFGFTIPEIPYLAKGTDNWQGGPAFMNERGGELAILPDGSQVIPADKTDKALDRPSRGVNIKNLIGELHIHQLPGEDAETFATRIINLLYEKLRDAKEIANNDEMGVLVNG